MKYTTTNEFAHFNFAEAYIQEVQVMEGLLHFYLDNVTILPDNSCNRDIREMRANSLILKLEGYTIESLIEEGYQHYDANGNLLHAYEDEPIEQDRQAVVLKSFAEGSIYEARQTEDTYVFYIDGAEDKTYKLLVKAAGDVEEWDRFLNKETGY